MSVGTVSDYTVRPIVLVLEGSWLKHFKMAHYPGQAHPLPTLGFLCADPLSSTPPPLSPSVPEAPSLILPSLRLTGCSRVGSTKPPSLKGHHSPPMQPYSK
ncbi:hypothetical protein KUCAC02_012187, partial [Chaenocephalus aceratus]